MNAINSEQINAIELTIKGQATEIEQALIAASVQMWAQQLDHSPEPQPEQASRWIKTARWEQLRRAHSYSSHAAYGIEAWQR